MKAYIDFRGPLMTVHRFELCDKAKVGPDESIRHVLINPDSISRELDRFRRGKHRFDENPGLHDMWLIFDFQDTEFEVALLKHLRLLMGLSHDRMKNCEIKIHC